MIHNFFYYQKLVTLALSGVNISRSNIGVVRSVGVRSNFLNVMTMKKRGHQISKFARIFHANCI